MPRLTRQICWPAALLVVSTVSAAPAAAQSQPRIEISANVGAMTGQSKFSESASFPSNVETATLTASHGVKSTVGFDVGGVARIVPRVWVGVQVAIAGMKSNASITALVPHPLLFNTPRTVQGSLDNVHHDERNVHVDVLYVLPVHAVDVKAMAGPTFFNLKQDFVSAVTVNETYPFDTATFAGATTTRSSKSAVGFNAGADVSRAISPHLGIGAIVRYSRGDVKFSGSGSAQQTVKAGGVEAAGGVRVRF